MKNLFRNRTIVGGACIVLSLINCFDLTPLYNGIHNAKTEISRVKKDISKGIPIKSAIIHKVEVGKYYSPSYVMSEEAFVLGIL